MRRLYIFGLVGLAGLIIGLAWADQMTFTTYYPAPHGVYNDMVVMNTLGIGTTTPGAPLEVTSANGGWNSANPYLADITLASDHGNRHDSSIMFWSTGSAGRILYNGDQFYFSTWNQNATSGAQARISTTSGASTYFLNNVGIGTTNPQQRLQLVNSSYLGLMTNGGSYIPTSWNRGNAGGIILSASANPNGTGWSYGSRIVNHDYGNGLGLSFDVNHAGSWTNDVLFISGRSGTNGNVGIGTTGPQAKLDVNGAIAAGGVNFPWRWTAASNAGSDFATTTWVDLPGTTITYNLPSAADVRVRFDGGIMASQLHVHCMLRFVMDGTPTGHSIWGDQIVMGEPGQHWEVLSRSRWFLNQAAGSHTVRIQGRSNPAGSNAHQCCLVDEDYSRLRAEVIAFPK